MQKTGSPCAPRWARRSCRVTPTPSGSAPRSRPQRTWTTSARRRTSSACSPTPRRTTRPSRTRTTPTRFFRDYLADRSINPGTVLNASVFTVAKVRDTMAEHRDRDRGARRADLEGLGEVRRRGRVAVRRREPGASLRDQRRLRRVPRAGLALDLPTGHDPVRDLGREHRGDRQPEREDVCLSLTIPRARPCRSKAGRSWCSRTVLAAASAAASGPRSRAFSRRHRRHSPCSASIRWSMARGARTPPRTPTTCSSTSSTRTQHAVTRCKARPINSHSPSSRPASISRRRRAAVTPSSSTARALLLRPLAGFDRGQPGAPVLEPL